LYPQVFNKDIKCNIFIIGREVIFLKKKTPNNLTSEVESTSNVTEANENK
jgi:hypothetical protein